MLFLLIFLPISLAQLTPLQLKEHCPKDPAFCHNKVAQGECFGQSLKANTLQKKCRCSCEAIHYERIQKCCLTVGEQEMKFCLPLCRYNTTSEELGSSLGIKCLSQLTTWAYCAADATDQTACCLAKGVPQECASFCKGDVPTCDTQAILSYQPCIQHMSTIYSCQKTGLTAKPRFDPNWSSECEWQG